MCHRLRPQGVATEVWAPQEPLLLWAQPPPTSPCFLAACSEMVCSAPMLCLVPRTLRVLGLQSVAWSRAVDYFPQSGRRLGDESSAASLPGQTPARESCLQLDWLYQMSASWYRTCTRRGARASTNRRSLWAQPSRSTGCEPSALRALLQGPGRTARARALLARKPVGWIFTDMAFADMISFWRSKVSILTYLLTSRVPFFFHTCRKSKTHTTTEHETSTCSITPISGSQPLQPPRQPPSPLPRERRRISTRAVPWGSKETWRPRRRC